jgi:hypothetical protein
VGKPSKLMTTDDALECCDCHEMLPDTSFNRNKNKISRRGRQRSCRKCERRYRQENDRTGTCCDCGKAIHRKSTRCHPCYGRSARTTDGWLTHDGYRNLFLPEHPNSSKNGSLGMHVVVMSQFMGRPLLSHERVHHRNGFRDDNRIENLELWSRSHPSGQRVDDKTAWAKEWLRQYEPEALMEYRNEAA